MLKLLPDNAGEKSDGMIIMIASDDGKAEQDNRKNYIYQK